MESLLAISPWDLSAQKAQANRLRSSGDTRAQLTEAARGFEDMLIRKWLETARKSSLEPKQGAMATYQAMGDDQLASMVSRQGGFGVANAMVDQMMAQIKDRVTDPAEMVASAPTPLKRSAANAVITPDKPH